MVGKSKSRLRQIFSSNISSWYISGFVSRSTFASIVNVIIDNHLELAILNVFTYVKPSGHITPSRRRHDVEISSIHHGRIST